MNEVVVSFGSNLEPDKNLKLAQDNLAKHDTLVEKSRFYTTKPLGYSDQPDFLNGAFLIQTQDSFEKFRQKLKQIEIAQGRVKTKNKNGPRCVDLDIVVWNRQIVDADFYERDFIRTTVLELIPNLNFTNENQNDP